MSMINLKPVTQSSRGTTLVDKRFLWKGSPYKSLVRKKTSSGGRNSRGVITVRHRGGGCKRSYRVVDFKRSNFNITGTVERLEYDPNRTAFLALISYQDGTKCYIIAPQGIKIGDNVVSSNSVEVSLGNCLMLKSIPVGSFIHNIELNPGKGGIIARAAGSYAQLMGKDESYVLLRLSSGQIRKVLSVCRATIGVVSNVDNQNIKLGKAGRKRWLGIRPTVRGVAMNPIDHPHGGGEGKTSGGRHPVTPWGVATKGKKTRKKGKASDKYINKRSFVKR